MTTISPGSTSRTNSAPCSGNTQLSEASTTGLRAADAQRPDTVSDSHSQEFVACGDNQCKRTFDDIWRLWQPQPPRFLHPGFSSDQSRDDLGIWRSLKNISLILHFIFESSSIDQRAVVSQRQRSHLRIDSKGENSPLASDPPWNISHDRYRYLPEEFS